MKKHTISKLFLYRHRFVIGYSILGLLFIAMLFFLPTITPNGLSKDEMDSVVTSFNLNHDSVLSGNIIDLPYHILQKYSIALFGLNYFGIKLPSIIIGGILGFLFILLLNRWFKNNVAIMASVLAVLSSSFLYIAGSGTPLIMIVFWPTLLLWLGSKIQGVTRPKPFYSFIFAIFLLLSIFTPYMIYLAVFIVLYVLVHPHLRFTVKHLPKIPFIFMTLVVIGFISLVIMNTVKNPSTISELLLMPDFTIKSYLSNIMHALIPFFQWNGMIESTFLSPLIGLASLTLAITGLISTYNGFFASRNSLATYLIIFTIIISGFNPNYAILLILPLAILIAHGFRYILNKWYGLFPENPYARVFGIFPIAIFLSIIIISDISHFIFGYRYNPAVANNFNNDLSIIYSNIKEETTLVVQDDDEYNFYKIIEKKSFINNKKIHITKNIPTNNDKIITLGLVNDDNDTLKNYKLDRIITNSKSQNSDRLYVYTFVSEEPPIE